MLLYVVCDKDLNSDEVPYEGVILCEFVYLALYFAF